MDNACCQPDTPSFQYYPPPTPTWLDPSLSSSSPWSSSQMPTWVKVAIGVAVLLLCCILYIFLKWRKKETSPSSTPDWKLAPTTWPPAKPPVEAATETPPPHVLEVKPPGPYCGAVPTMPSSCPSCAYSGGLYHMKCRCPWCSFRKEVGVHIQYPS
ncbi:hypothetical protein NL676_031623 [Syzygium grande]|nr:hypothetical protein NL676_031623 [Syzygium grande]